MRANVSAPAIDYLVDGIVAHQDDDVALLHWGRALDRVLLGQHYMVPQWHTDHYRLAYWNKFGQPKTLPKHGIGIAAWWFVQTKAQAL